MKKKWNSWSIKKERRESWSWFAVKTVDIISCTHRCLAGTLLCCWESCWWTLFFLWTETETLVLLAALLSLGQTFSFVWGMWRWSSLVLLHLLVKLFVLLLLLHNYNDIFVLAQDKFNIKAPNASGFCDLFFLSFFFVLSYFVAMSLMPLLSSHLNRIFSFFHNFLTYSFDLPVYWTLYSCLLLVRCFWTASVVLTIACLMVL